MIEKKIKKMIELNEKMIDKKIKFIMSVALF